MNDQAWFEHFKDKLQALSFDSGVGESPLSQALKRNLLTSEEYLHWACSHFGLPQIKSEFFTKNSFPQNLYSKVATQYSWSSECMPIAEWDGTLIVACLQPPQDFPQQLIPATFVLASYKDIQIYFNHIHGEKSESAPEGFDLSFKTSPKIASQFSADDLLGSSVDSPTQVALESEESLEGLNITNADESEMMPEGLFSTETTSLDLSSLAAPVAKKPSIPPPPQEERPVIQTLASKTPPPPPADAKPAAIFDQEQENAFITPVEAIKIPETEFPEEVSSPLIEVASFKSDDIPEDTISQIIELKPETPTVLETLKKSPAAITKITYNNQVNSKFALERYKKKNSDLAKKIETSISELKNHFDQVMLLAINDDQTFVLPFAIDQSVQNIKDFKNSVPLNVPSIFNIAFTTQKSFHGYVSINEINEKFFDEWNGNSIPDHVTISPIVEGELVIGMFMGIGTKKSYTRTALNVSERHALSLLAVPKATIKAA